MRYEYEYKIRDAVCLGFKVSFAMKLLILLFVFIALASNSLALKNGKLKLPCFIVDRPNSTI